MRAFILSVISCFLFSATSWGQISQGGSPLEIAHLKSAGVPVIDMPAFNIDLEVKSANKEQAEEKKLKPFKFAHGFNVNISPEKDGVWTTNIQGIDVWQVKIRSEGAYSLNLVFDNFHLQNGARLFVFSENERYCLGAFTSLNNKSSGKFAVMPVAGEELTVQYEVPTGTIGKKDIVISYVGHDFVGILKSDDRRPLYPTIAGGCNIDVNCDLGEDWKDTKNAVCRIIITRTNPPASSEICTGALINNTAEDQKPYVLSAAHCYDRWEYAETSVYVFNYESPYCAPLDGDPSNSVSGALMKAQFDSMDFALAELSLIPPPEFRPYYAGWERSVTLPDSTVSIHHPQGDIKKIAMDEDLPEITDFSSRYTDNGFLKILRWDEGVTEVGSSGGPLFNMEQNIIGTLTGGLAICANPIDDYFERFAMSWDYKSDSAKQLKYWLDPSGSDTQRLDGKQFYEGEEICEAFTNLNDDDEHDNIPIFVSEEFSGYWGGTNSVGITEFVEQFSIYGNEQLSGISLGVGKIDKNQSNTQSQITIKVYDGNEQPETLIYSKNIFIKDLVEDAMNFIGFDEIVEPIDTFFVGFELSNMLPLDSFVVYQSLRPANTENFFYFKQDGIWQSYKDESMGYNSIVNVFELVVCNTDDTLNDKSIVDDPEEFLVFPNPTQNVFTIAGGSEITEEDILISNLLGQFVEFKSTKIHERKIEINLAGNVPGVYFVRINTSEGFVSRKVSYVPW